MEYIPSIKVSENIQNSTAEQVEKYGKEERFSLLAEAIKKNPYGKIVKKDTKKNDVWFRKKVGDNLVGVDAMKSEANVKVLKGQYFPDPENGEKEKLFLYCEVDNTTTVHGGKKGKDKGWIYAGYINMELPKVVEPAPGDWKSRFTPLNMIEKEQLERFDATDVTSWGDYYYEMGNLRFWASKPFIGLWNLGGVSSLGEIAMIKRKNPKNYGVEEIIGNRSTMQKISIPSGIFQGVKNGPQIATILTQDNINTMKPDTLLRIKQKALEIKRESSGRREEIIAKVYQYVIDKTSYESSTGNYFESLAKGERVLKPEVSADVHSGIKTFENNMGVCDGYSELVLLLLSFAGIDNVQVMTGTASMSDKAGSPKFGHAWLKIDNLHYDVTNDDNESGKKRYFGVTETELRSRGYDWDVRQENN